MRVSPAQPPSTRLMFNDCVRARGLRGTLSQTEGDRDRTSLPRPGRGGTREQEGRWVVRPLPLRRAAGAAGMRRRPLAVLEARGPAQ
eukprot:34405-Pleurochrysis_carterae.AAC.3